MKEGTIVGIDNLNNYYDPSLKEYVPWLDGKLWNKLAVSKGVSQTRLTDVICRIQV